MGKLVKMACDIEVEQKYNVKQLSALIEKYMPTNKTFVINKIKKEQKF